MKNESEIETGCPICGGGGCQTCLLPEEFVERMSKEIEDKNEKDETEDEDDENKDTDKSAKETVKKDEIEDDGLDFDCELCMDQGCQQCSGSKNN